MGVRFDATPLIYFWQYLDPELLRTDLARSVFFLHSQPPLFNLFLGAVLRAVPGAPDVAFAACYAAMTLGLLLSMAWLMRRLGVSEPLAVVLVTVYALHPTFIIHGHWLFYTLPVGLLLVLTTVALWRWAETGRARFAQLFAWLAGAVMLTRASYHALWFVAVVTALLPILVRSRRRHLLLAAIGPFLVVNLWYAKNLAQVGVYGPSSWLGMNLARHWELPQEEASRLVEQGRLPPVWTREPFLSEAHYSDLGYFAAGERGRGHPALDAPYRSTGQPNYNHRDYARISRDMFSGGMALIAAEPLRYLERVGRAFTLFVDPGPGLLLVTYDVTRLKQFAAAWQRVLSLGVLAFALPVVVISSLILAARRTTPVPARTALMFAGVTVIWIGLCTSLVEQGENDRMRAELDPLLVVLAGLILARAITYCRRGTSTVEPLPEHAAEPSAADAAAE